MFGLKDLLVELIEAKWSKLGDVDFYLKDIED
jgi:hypothetical protein